MPSTPAAGVGLDLRRDEHRQLRERVVGEVRRALGTDLDTGSLVIKRRSLGALTERGTWVRTEVRPLHKLYGQPPDGVEAAALIDGVNKPRWYRGLSWHDSELEVMWRADESDYVADRPIITGGVLSAQPDLSEAWWRDLGASLDALAAATTTRVATVDTVPITQQRITTTIQAAFGPQSDTTVTAWGGIHADLGWANLTGPRLAILDWEDFGRGPVGMDQARLWAASLVVPELRARIEAEFEPVFTGRTGRLSQLFVLAELLNAPLGHAGPLREHAEAAAAALGLPTPSSTDSQPKPTARCVEMRRQAAVMNYRQVIIEFSRPQGPSCGHRVSAQFSRMERCICQQRGRVPSGIDPQRDGVLSPMRSTATPL